MSDLARQYNIIGETLRQGIGDLMQGAAAGKAMELQAMRTGVRTQQMEFDNLAKKRQLDMQQKANDLVRQKYEDAKSDPRLKKEQAIAKAEMEVFNRPGTEYSLGIDQPWEKDWFDDKIIPLMKKDLGIVRNEKGNFVMGDKELTHGELKQNTDIAGLMIANIDPSHMVRKQKDLEEQRLQEMYEPGYFDSMGGDDEMKERAIEQQKDLIGKLDNQIVDMDNKPIKYLNTQINTLADFMSGSINPEVHMIRFNELSARRASLVKQKIEAMKQAGKDPQLYQQKIYDSNGDVVYSKWLPKSVTPMQDPDINAVIRSRQKSGNKSYLDKPAVARRTDKVAAEILGSMGGSIELLKKYRQGGKEEAAKYITDIYNASAGMLGAEMVNEPEIQRRIDGMEKIGVNFKDDALTVMDAKQKIVDALNDGTIEVGDAEKYFETLNTVAGGE